MGSFEIIAKKESASESKQKAGNGGPSRRIYRRAENPVWESGVREQGHTLVLPLNDVDFVFAAIASLYGDAKTLVRPELQFVKGHPSSPVPEQPASVVCGQRRKYLHQQEVPKFG